MRTSDLTTQMGVMLIMLEEFSVIPDLWSFFSAQPEGANGCQEFLRFIDTFAGLTISIPEEEKVKRTLKMIHIYTLIEGAEDQKRAVKEAGNFYSVSDTEVLRLYRKVRDLIQDHQERMLRGTPEFRRPFRPSKKRMETLRRKRDGMKKKDRLQPPKG